MKTTELHRNGIETENFFAETLIFGFCIQCSFNLAKLPSVGIGEI
jgi:hypothetical protein